jgi:hypothetical protein
MANSPGTSLVLGALGGVGAVALAGVWGLVREDAALRAVGTLATTAAGGGSLIVLQGALGQSISTSPSCFNLGAASIATATIATNLIIWDVPHKDNEATAWKVVASSGIVGFLSLAAAFLLKNP